MWLQFCGAALQATICHLSLPKEQRRVLSSSLSLRLQGSDWQTEAAHTGNASHQCPGGHRAAEKLSLQQLGSAAPQAISTSPWERC